MKWLLSISYCAHDASICLLKDNQVELFLCEERSSRIKRDSSFPLSCLKYVKQYTNTIDLVVFGNICNDYYDCVGVLRYFFKEGIKVLDHHIDEDHHHIYHAASGFYNSGFQESAVIVIDGWGGLGEKSIGKGSPSGEKVQSAETTSIYYASYPSRFKLLFKNFVYEPKLMLEVDEQLFEDEKLDEENYVCNLTNHLDIGVMYGIVSNFLGFGSLDGGKTMGLSSYGNFDLEIPPMFSENPMMSNMNLFTGSRSLNKKVYPYLKDMSSFKKRANFAFSIQKALEHIFIKRVEFVLENCNTKNIILSGGCALNVVGNSILKKKFPEINFYIDPIPNDAGQSLGLAKYFYHEFTNSMEIKPIKNLYNGPNYNLDDLKTRIVNKVHLINQ